MTDKNHRYLLFPVDSPQNAQHLVAMIDIKMSDGLVKHNDTRLLRKHHSQNHPLLLSSAQFHKIAVFQVQHIGIDHRTFDNHIILF